MLEHVKRGAVTWAQELIWWSPEPAELCAQLWCWAREGTSQGAYSGISSWRLQEPYVSFYVFSFHVYIINSSGEACVLVHTAKPGNWLGSIFKPLGLLNVRAYVGLLLVLQSHTIGPNYVCSLRVHAWPWIQIKLGAKHRGQQSKYFCLPELPFLPPGTAVCSPSLTSLLSPMCWELKMK